jgi:predicted nicotinamide N-methyase
VPAEQASAELFVQSSCRLRPVPLVPEIRLYQADEVTGVWERTEERAAAGQPPPFWAFPWPGGQALARHLLDHAGLAAGRSVLDLGSGSGLVAIAARLAGAASVLASEVDQVAAAAIGLNARANQVRAPEVVGDVLDGDGEGAQVVLAGDVWYSEQLASRALGLIERARARGGSVLTGDIGRTFLPRDRFRVVDTMDVPVVAALEDSEVKRTMIWAPAW